MGDGEQVRGRSAAEAAGWWGLQGKLATGQREVSKGLPAYNRPQ